MYDQSHISWLSRAPNANTRFVTAGPRLEVAWLDEAYARARAIDAPQMTAPGVRLVWWRGREVGWHDLVAHPRVYAVLGRHTQCDAVLPSDPAVALRHLLLRAATLDDGTTALRVLDLRTGLGFHLDDDEERRGLVATGVLAMRIGRYALVAIPSGVELPDTRPAPEVLESAHVPTLRGTVSRGGCTSVTALPPAPLLDDIARDTAATGHVKVTLRRGEAWATIELPEAALDAGVLVGRADRCEPRLRAVLTESISRVHLLLLREHGAVYGFDLCSTQGVWADGTRMRRVRLPDQGGTLRLASREPVLLDWHPRPAAADLA
jgi:hypothetical protein